MELIGRARNTGLTPELHSSMSPQTNDTREVKEVWCYNLDNELNAIMNAATRYPYIGMDTEFPGICFCTKEQQLNFFEYNIIRENVNNLKIIQLGITFCTNDGIVAEDCPTWQFNFRFDPLVDMSNAESIQLLKMAGIDFNAHASKGIDPRRFGELLTMSGLVLSPSITWIAFHGIYDFAYLLRILTGTCLPDTQKDFYSILHIFFPHIFDIKVLMGECSDLTGGLNRVADQMSVSRVGTAHQSGSDSRITAETFFSIRNVYFRSGIDNKFDGILFDVANVKV